MNLGTFAHGTIEPQPRIVSGDITEAEIEQFLEELRTDAFYDSTQNFMPKCCVDGRHRADNTCQLGANAAGGVFSLLAADMLSRTQTLRRGATNTKQYADNLCAFLGERFAGQFGDHNADTVAQQTDSGCGAIDKMPAVIGLIAHHGDELRQLAGAIGATIVDEDFDVITARAKAIADDHDITVDPGATMVDVLKKAAGNDSVETLTGIHNEVVVVVNEREGTTLNRAKIKARYGDRLQAFNYDRWAMRKAVREISDSQDEADARLKLAAADMYNLAVTCTLAGPSLRGLVRE
jgi:hypothetical protein